MLQKVCTYQTLENILKPIFNVVNKHQKIRWYSKKCSPKNDQFSKKILMLKQIECEWIYLMSLKEVWKFWTIFSKISKLSPISKFYFNFGQSLATTLTKKIIKKKKNSY